MYYMRNEALNANNFFNNRLRTSRPVNRFNAVTYNIGGPVYVPEGSTAIAANCSSSGITNICRRR